ncbi:hypothetical protein PAXINDRAFT_96895 [Paxillus involutus ATCC 200175]|nr:hypothetical protein PAXINDRAFT_96895 [Paxillus involutus ATCC 200175]
MYKSLLLFALLLLLQPPARLLTSVTFLPPQAITLCLPVADLLSDIALGLFLGNSVSRFTPLPSQRRTAADALAKVRRTHSKVPSIASQPSPAMQRRSGCHRDRKMRGVYRSTMSPPQGNFEYAI